jgi:hypothetical protein
VDNNGKTNVNKANKQETNTQRNDGKASVNKANKQQANGGMHTM